MNVQTSLQPDLETAADGTLLRDPRRPQPRYSPRKAMHNSANC